MKYGVITFTHLDGTDGINIVRIDGEMVTTLGLGEDDAGYQAWLAEGNEPQEWNPEESD